MICQLVSYSYQLTCEFISNSNHCLIISNHYHKIFAKKAWQYLHFRTSNMILTSRLAFRCLIFFVKQFWWKWVSSNGNLIQPKPFGLTKWTETISQYTGDLTRSSQVGTGQITYWVLDHHQVLTNTNIKNLLNPTKIKFQYLELNIIDHFYTQID